MIACAAAGDNYFTGCHNRVAERLYFVIFLVRRGLDAYPLLKYFLDGVMCKLALVGIGKLPCDLCDAPGYGLASEIENVRACDVHYCNVAVVKKHRLIGILQKTKHVT